MPNKNTSNTQLIRPTATIIRDPVVCIHANMHTHSVRNCSGCLPWTPDYLETSTSYRYHTREQSVSDGLSGVNQPVGTVMFAPPCFPRVKFRTPAMLFRYCCPPSKLYQPKARIPQALSHRKRRKRRNSPQVKLAATQGVFSIQIRTLLSHSAS